MKKVVADYETEDVMSGADRYHMDVLDKGFVALVDIMPRLVPKGSTADSAIVTAARVSYGAGTKKSREDRSLIRYLLRHNHTSPFEMVNLKWHCKMPIFVARQWIRHRTASVNEYSGRYSKMKAEFWRPDGIRRQDTVNKQGSINDTDEELLERFELYLEESERQYNSYEVLVEEGLGKELARTGLPLSMYTEWYWEIDLHNLMHFLRLRMDSHAQKEIRDYAKIMFEITKEVCPWTMEAFEDYVLNSITFTGPELRALRCSADDWKDILTGREIIDLTEKWEAFQSLTNGAGDAE